MKILAIGCVFESHSFIVSDFCHIDSESKVINYSSCVDGAAVVVSSVGTWLNDSCVMLTKGSLTSSFISLFDLLNSVNIKVDLLPEINNGNNKLFSFFNSESERMCYSYIPCEIKASELISYDFSHYDAVFFCCLPYNELSAVFSSNYSLKDTCTIIVGSGLTHTYFCEKSFLLPADFIFMNRGELFEIYQKKYENTDDVEICISNLLLGSTSVVVTMGHDGIAGIITGDYFSFSVSPVDVIDPAGAGDSFATGFIHSFLQGKSVEQCCKKGHECAIKMLSVVGAEGFIRKYMLNQT